MQPYQEFYSADGKPRPHQKRMAEYLSGLDRAKVESLSRVVRERLVEQEVSFNLLGAPDGSARAWVLDALPHIVDAADFSSLSGKLAKRARVLSACLDDIYGPQRLIREHIMPSHLVLENPRYFRALHGVVPIGAQRLIFYAVDVIRGPDGEYSVHSDRTSIPSGAGYALENRLTIGQVHAEAFRDYRVRKVNSFFAASSETLEALHPRQGTAPRIVLLTPGQHDESSFEHGYLARYQGLELVEGRDLTVRGNEVFLKTLEGLKKVDVILRRLVDDWCDPLELRQDSLLGVPGLVSAVRAGSVGIANPLGSCVVECPAFRAYLPQISRALLGEELSIDSIPTRYLGDALHLEEVLDSWDNWTIRPAFYDRREISVQNGTLSPEESASLKKKVLAQPRTFVAEAPPPASRVPLSLDFKDEGSLGLRLFACLSGGDFTVMPGGLARANSSTDGIFLPGDETATSKDVWVLGEKGTRRPALPRMPEPPVALRRGGIDLPSRLFDDIFWLGRYAERCDGTGRLIRQGLEPIIEEGQELAPDVALALRAAMVSLRLNLEADAKESVESLLLAATYDGSRPNSIRSTLDRIHSLTTATRSRLSVDTWKTLRRLTSVKLEPEGKTSAHAIEAVEEVLLNLAAYRGLVGANMVRGHAWMFLELGRRIERGVYVLTLLIDLFAAGESRLRMETLLRICDSLLTYRSRYLSTLQATPVVDLLLTDDTNPQSVLFQVRRLLLCVRKLPSDRPFPLSGAEQHLIRLEANLVTADLETICNSQGEDLRKLAEEGIRLLWQVSDDIANTYFTHSDPSRSVGGVRGATAEWVGQS